MTCRTPQLIAAVAATALAFTAIPASANPRFEYVQSNQLQNAPSGIDFTMGNRKAPVILVEYASLSCPHCARFHKDVLPVLMKQYIDKGKLLYILRPYPLNEPALKAAELVDCVGEKSGSERYYTFVRVLFDTQTKWAFDTNWAAALATIARVGGVNADMYDKCTSDPQREIKVLKIKRAGTNELEVEYTPYLFINNHRYDDDASPAKLVAYIDKVLAAVQDAASKPGKPQATNGGSKPVDGKAPAAPVAGTPAKADSAPDKAGDKP